MKTKKLDQNLFGNLELNNANMNDVKGGLAKIVDSCYSGSGPAGGGGIATEWCDVYSDGHVGHRYIIC